MVRQHWVSLGVKRSDNYLWKTGRRGGESDKNTIRLSVEVEEYLGASMDR
jgi:hypothetical protein